MRPFVLLALFCTFARSVGAAEEEPPKPEAAKQEAKVDEAGQQIQFEKD